MPHNTTAKKPAAGWKPWMGLFLVMCVLALIWSIPASVLPRLLSLSGAGGSMIQIGQTRGTLWSGHAMQLLINANQQQLLLENVSWRLNWRSLLDRRLCLAISSNPVASSNLSFAGQSCLFSSGSIQLSDAVFELPASMLVSAQLANSPLMRGLSSSVQIEGNISGVIDNLVWQSEGLQQLSASGLWSHAALVMQLPDAQTLRMRRQQLRLDTLSWTAASRAANELFLHVHSSDTTHKNEADLQVDSQSEIWLDGRYATQLQLQVLASTPQFLQDILTIIAQPQGSGLYRLVWRNIAV